MNKEVLTRTSRNQTGKATFPDIYRAGPDLLRNRDQKGDLRKRLHPSTPYVAQGLEQGRKATAINVKMHGC